VAVLRDWTASAGWSRARVARRTCAGVRGGPCHGLAHGTATHGRGTDGATHTAAPAVRGTLRGSADAVSGRLNWIRPMAGIIGPATRSRGRYGIDRGSSAPCPNFVAKGRTVLFLEHSASVPRSVGSVKGLTVNDRSTPFAVASAVAGYRSLSSGGSSVVMDAMAPPKVPLHKSLINP